MNRVTGTLANSPINDPLEQGRAMLRPNRPDASCHEHRRQPYPAQTTTILAPPGHRPSPPPLSERPPEPLDRIESP